MKAIKPYLALNKLASAPFENIFALSTANIAQIMNPLPSFIVNIPTLFQPFGIGEIIWGLIFLVRHCPSHFVSTKFVFLTGQLIIWDL